MNSRHITDLTTCSLLENDERYYERTLRKELETVFVPEVTNIMKAYTNGGIREHIDGDYGVVSLYQSLLSRGGTPMIFYFGSSPKYYFSKQEQQGMLRKSYFHTAFMIEDERVETCLPTSPALVEKICQRMSKLLLRSGVPFSV